MALVSVTLFRVDWKGEARKAKVGLMETEEEAEQLAGHLPASVQI